MKSKHSQKYFVIASVFFALFAALIILVMAVDVQPIGPEGSNIGLATINGFLFDALGANELWYTVTTILGYLAMLVACGFAAFGLYQVIRRRSIRRIDRDILALGAFYVIVAACYAFFEVFIVNYRPILVDGVLEASFPSSHTMLVCCVMSSAIIQVHARIDNELSRVCLIILSALVVLTMIIGRLLSGVHWFTDIMGGLLLSAALIAMYYAVFRQVRARR